MPRLLRDVRMEEIESACLDLRQRLSPEDTRIRWELSYLRPTRLVSPKLRVVLKHFPHRIANVFVNPLTGTIGAYVVSRAVADALVQALDLDRRYFGRGDEDDGGAIAAMDNGVYVRSTAHELRQIEDRKNQ